MTCENNTTVEGSPKKKNKRSLTYRLGNSILKALIILVMISMFAGATLYLIPAVSNLVNTLSYIMLNTSAYMTEDEEVLGAIKELVEISKDSKDESRKERVDALEGSQGFDMIRSVCEVIPTKDGLNELFLADYDAENGQVIYLCDPAPMGDAAHETGEREDMKLIPVVGEKAQGVTTRMGISNVPGIGIAITGAIPIYNEDYTPFCYLMGRLSLKTLIRNVSTLLLAYLLLLTVVVIVITICMNRRLRRILVDPLQRITQATQSYIDDKQNDRNVPAHFDQLELHDGDEIQQMGEVMADMERGLNAYEEELQQAVAEKERINTELSLAAKIQAEMLPTSFPAFPEREEFDVYASMTPAKEVGGDFYDFFLVDEDHLALVIADVSDKGVPAALFMMASKIIINNFTTPDRKPSVVLQKANDALCARNPERMFVTVWLGILEISTGRLIASNAGHEKPVLVHADGSAELMEDKHGLVLGVMEGMKYSDYELKMHSGDQLFVYTDGVPEANSPTNELFGLDRMVEAIQKSPKETPQQVLQGVRAAVDEFVGEAEQFDDLTMLCVQRSRS